MKQIILYKEDNVDVNIESISDNLNQICKNITFRVGKSRFSLSESNVSFPTSFVDLCPAIKKETHGAYLAILVTTKPYDNNYFFEGTGNAYILSLSDWEYLTPLPKNNGLVYFIVDLIALDINSEYRHEENVTGCIYDFLWDKTGVDIGMRSAMICSDCLNRLESSNLSMEEDGILQDLRLILDRLSIASRWNKDLIEEWQPQHKSTSNFDVFLCHNTQDKELIRNIAAELKGMGPRPWLDEEQIRPGLPWQRVLEDAIGSINSVAVFVGKNGRGPWQDVEIQSYLSEFIKRGCPIIPVILDDCEKTPELPIFLKNMMWVDFRKDNPPPMNQLKWGITGNR